MPQKGPAYPITKDWQRWVREGIDALIARGEVKSDAAFARSAGFSKVALHDALKDGAIQTTVMPKIHKALNWPAPLKAPPIHILAFVEGFQKLDPITQGRWLERLRQELTDEQTKRRR